MSLATAEPINDLPNYDRGGWSFDGQWLAQKRRFAQQILATTAPFLSRPVEDLNVLDVGSGNGGMALCLAQRCASVVGIDPCQARTTVARQVAEEHGVDNVEFHVQDITSLDPNHVFDLVVLDNVLEHLPDQAAALASITRALAPGGVLYILVPNKLWPMEVHYRLPFLSYLPLPLANLYLRWSGRGTDYTDASYAPTYGSLKRLMAKQEQLDFHFVLPADLQLATRGNSWLYRYGVAAIKRCPWLWTISKALLVVAVKRA